MKVFRIFYQREDKLYYMDLSSSHITNPVDMMEYTRIILPTCETVDISEIAAIGEEKPGVAIMEILTPKEFGINTAMFNFLPSNFEYSDTVAFHVFRWKLDTFTVSDTVRNKLHELKKNGDIVYSVVLGAKE